MSLKRCRNCGLPIGGLGVCPSCGAKADEDSESDKSANAFGNKAEISFIARKFKIGELSLSAWDIAFIILCNVSLVAILINAVIGGKTWCAYPVIGAFTVYFFSYACSSKTAGRFLTRYRNAVMFMNFVCGILGLMFSASESIEMGWTFDYFIPVNIFVSCNVILCLILTKKVPMRNILISSALIMIQSIAQLILMLFGVTATGQVAQILVYSAFGVNALTTINLTFFYFIKYRNAIVEKFKFWE